jgi:hypothetical protein
VCAAHDQHLFRFFRLTAIAQRARKELHERQ